MTIESISLIGLLGGVCFSYCGVPTAIGTIRAGRSVGTPVDVAWMILIGAIAMYAYLMVKHGFDWVLTINYSIEAISWGVIVYYHYFFWRLNSDQRGSV